MSKGKILVVDDDPFFTNLYTDILEKGGFEVTSVTSGRKAVEMIEADDIDVVITELIMEDISGQEVLERTKQHNALIDVIIITAQGTIESAITALKSGAFDYLRKPVNYEELLLTVNRCMEQKQLVNENRRLMQSRKLLEVSRTITSCLDIDKLYILTLDALLQEIAGHAGICLFLGDDDGTFEIKAVRRVGTEEGKILADLFMKRIREERRPPEKATLYDLKDLGEGDVGGNKEFNTIIAAPIRGESAAVIGYLLILSQCKRHSFDIADLENASFIAEQASLSFENAEKYRRAKNLAYVDSLTDLYNPRYLNIVLDREIKRSNRSMTPFSVLFMDIDHFKEVNDVHGHLIGSKLLVEVSRLLIKSVRDVDAVVRYGGDEYVIILVDTDHDTAFNVAERIRSLMENHTFLGDENLAVRITASIGLATYPTHAKDKKDLLDMADKAMYYGKDKSRNSVYIAPLPEKEGLF